MRAGPSFVTFLSFVLVAGSVVFTDPAAPAETAQGAAREPSVEAIAMAARSIEFPIGFEPAGGASFRAAAGGYEILLDAAGVSFVERAPGPSPAPLSWSATA